LRDARLKPQKIIYWSRVGFGLLAALLCGLLRFDRSANPFLTGISLALIVYIVTYYIYKALFAAKVKKRSQLVTMGIGAFFLAWILAWTLFSTLMHPLAAFTYSPALPTAGDPIVFDATGSYDMTGHIVRYEWEFGDGSAANVTSPTTTHAYTEAGDYTVTLTVEDNEGYAVQTSKPLEVNE
jgi:hypothetical protein